MKLASVGSAAAGALLAAALTVAAGTTATQAAAIPVIVTSQQGNVLEVAVTPPPRRGPGWEGDIIVPAPTGQDLVLTYGCPHSSPIPLSGTFFANTAAQVGFQLVGDGRSTSKLDDWEWTINWPSGAPSGSQITINVYCTKKT